MSYPKNGHYTQVLWRATEYVGCGEASIPVKANRGLRRNNNRPGRGKNKRPNKTKANKGGKRGKNDKNEGKGDSSGKGDGNNVQSKTGKGQVTGGFQCHIQVCRYARYVLIHCTCVFAL